MVASADHATTAGPLLALLTVVVAAFLTGRLFRAVGQPTVLGEMVAGIVLGPTLLGAMAPGLHAYVFSPFAQDLLRIIGIAGLAVYMFYVGVEHRGAKAPAGLTKVAVRVASAGVLLPLALGVVLAATLLARFRPEGVDQATFAAFVGGALAVTAFPMLGRVVQERGIAHTRLGVVAIRAAALDDLVAWCLLAAVVASLRGDVLQAVTTTLIPAAVFVVVTLWALPRLIGPMAKSAATARRLSANEVAVVLGVILAAAAFTEWIGVYAVFGGFVVGLACPGGAGMTAALENSLMPVIRAFLLPMFFASSGLVTDLGSIASTGDGLVLLAVLLVAFAAKLIAPLVALVRVPGWGLREAAALGALLNARGLMILIFINVGLDAGVIDARLFAMLTVVAVVTTGLAQPAYRAALSVDGEERMKASVLPSERDPAVQP